MRSEFFMLAVTKITSVVKINLNCSISMGPVLPQLL